MLHSLIELVATLPLIDLPDPEPVMPPGFEPIIQLLGFLKWGGLIVLLGGLIILFARLAVNSRRGEGGEHMQQFVWIMVGVIGIGAAAGLIGLFAG